VYVLFLAYFLALKRAVCSKY